VTGAPSLRDYVSESDLDRLADVIADLLIAGARRQAVATTNSAGDCRPLSGGVHPNSTKTASLPREERDAVSEEDSRRDRLTSTDKY